jgi:hypothetical protein
MNFEQLPKLRLPTPPDEPERFATLADVFGISRSIPYNYVCRDDINGRLVEAISRGRHVVIHGSSKQGKTCLRKWNIEDRSYVALTCSNNWLLADINISILKQAGYVISQSDTKTATGEHKVTAKSQVKISLPGFEGTSAIEGTRGSQSVDETSSTSLELDPSDINEVILALQELAFDKYIVLEDFHYLPRTTQQDFAVALKALHESSELIVIVVGVWLDENKLVQFNGDLTGRVVAINADSWSRDQLRAVIERGAEILDVSFADSFVEGVLNECFDSVWIVQEACFQACREAGIIADISDVGLVGESVDVPFLIREIVDQQSARYSTFIPAFAEGDGQDELGLYRWILGAVLVSDVHQLPGGLAQQDLRDFLSEHHPRRPIKESALRNTLRRIVRFQAEELGVKPPILDFDESARRLNVVDRSFLIWLEHQDVGELFDDAGLPGTFVRQWAHETQTETPGRHRK